MFSCFDLLLINTKIKKSTNKKSKEIELKHVTSFDDSYSGAFWDFSALIDKNQYFLCFAAEIKL